MGHIVTFGDGGYCENCHSAHDHPLNNIIEVVEIPDEPEQVDPVKQAALDKLMKLGLTEEEAMAIAGL